MDTNAGNSVIKLMFEITKEAYAVTSALFLQSVTRKFIMHTLHKIQAG
jgi:hypothetical protein